MSKSKPLAFFRVYTLKSPSLFFKVYVWKTKRQLHSVRKIMGGDVRGNKNCIAFTYIPLKVSHLVGELHFYKDKIGSSTVSHEIAHATITILRRKDYNFGKLSDLWNNNEEVFCNELDHLTLVIVNKLHDFGFYK